MQLIDGKIVYTELESMVEKALSDYAAFYDIDDYTDVPQTRWNTDVMSAVGQTLFPKKTRSIIKPADKYDMDKVLELVDIFINLCGRYKKEVTKEAFIKLSNMSRDQYYEWAKETDKWRDGRNRLSSARSDVDKIIRDADIQSLHALSLDGKYFQAVNSIGIHKKYPGFIDGNMTIHANARDLLPRRSINEQNDRLEADNMPLLPE